ncbi:hypothetical protein BU17DRAFT_72704 [Hysterangium stoloniferum]|nr:hypothetical protein BU17DRAFT_72704 [Hysterangium stoloniferum]
MVPGIISISTWIFTPISQKLLSVILQHYVSDTQFKVLDIISILLGYKLPGFNRGFSPFLAAVTGFKIFTNLELNLEQAAGLFGWRPFVTAMCHSEAQPSSVVHLPHSLRVHIEETICRELKQRHAAVIGSACITLIHTALVFTLLGAIVYFAHSRLQNAHVRGERVADQATAADDGNVEGGDATDHAPAVDGGNVEGTNDADHAPAVDDGSVEGNSADRPAAVDDGSLEGTDADPDSTPRISWKTGERESTLESMAPSCWMDRYGRDHSPSALCKTNTTIHPKSQTAGDDGSEYMVPESSFIDDDDEATEQKVLAGTSTQTDLSPAFVGPFPKRAESCVKPVWPCFKPAYMQCIKYYGCRRILLVISSPSILMPHQRILDIFRQPIS